MLGQAGDTTRLRRSAARGLGEADVARGGTQGWFPLEDGAVLPWHPMLVPAGRWSGTTVAVHHSVIREHEKVCVRFKLGLVDKKK